MFVLRTWPQTSQTLHGTQFKFDKKKSLSLKFVFDYACFLFYYWFKSPYYLGNWKVLYVEE